MYEVKPFEKGLFLYRKMWQNKCFYLSHPPSPLCGRSRRAKAPTLPSFFLVRTFGEGRTTWSRTIDSDSPLGPKNGSLKKIIFPKTSAVMFDISHSQIFFLSKIFYSNLTSCFTEVGHLTCPASSAKETFYEYFQLVKNLTTHPRFYSKDKNVSLKPNARYNVNAS